MKHCVVFSIILLVVVLNLAAQEKTDFQDRTIIHLQADVSEKIFLTGWVIGNAQYYGTNNINIFGGIGYRNKNWWFESMIQKQWKEKDGNSPRKALLFDNRFQYQPTKRTSLYIEIAPFLDRKALYDMVVIEQKIIGGLGVGFETENVHKTGKDSLGAGPRVSLPFGSLGGCKIVTALSYQFRQGQERNVLRFYLVFNRRLEN